MIGRGRCYPLGASVTPRGVNFAVFSAHATSIEVCVFDSTGEHELQRFALPARTGDIWHGELSGASVGLVYALRAAGPWQPEAGHRFDASMLLLDPCAREILEGDLRKARVVRDEYDWGDDARPEHAREDLVIYELHVKGFSMLNPLVPPALRGSYAALAHPASVAHLRSLGITAVSLLPVHQHLDEPALVSRGLVNYWGYNTLGFFCADWRYASAASRAAPDPGRALRDEFRDMVKALHAAGIEVILDVVFNHTCESDEHGPTLSWRGLDNASWYRLESPPPLRYANDTGCGNTLDLRHPRVLQFVMDSLRFWVAEMHVDGFRFDLAPVLARGDHGFDSKGPFFQVIAQDPVLAHARLVAEPWDVGHGGYQLGAFPRGWLEWNDRFRDTARRWWITGEATRGEWAQRLCGSADTLQHRDREPTDSVNYVVSHDGFTLRDLVSYAERCNEANGEHNRDGHTANHSRNYGVEGDTDEPRIRERRDRVQRALLASVLLSQGTPMLAAGSELGHTQRGNNNAYCQDGPLSWLDWAGPMPTCSDWCSELRRCASDIDRSPMPGTWVIIRAMVATTSVGSVVKARRSRRTSGTIRSRGYSACICKKPVAPTRNCRCTCCSTLRRRLRMPCCRTGLGGWCWIPAVQMERRNHRVSSRWLQLSHGVYPWPQRAC